MHPLDRPVWASLDGAHRTLSEGDDRARRCARDVNLFASALDDSEAALAALAELVRPGEQVFVLQVPPIVVPRGLVAVKRARGVQMVATRSLAHEPVPAGLAVLGDADAADMLHLARLTEPGPFLPRTHTMGRFVGVREGTRLAGMAGERFRPPGCTEVSGVCTHPDCRGRGLARGLSAAVAARIQQRGELPFLHAWQTNVAAIRLYESLGFVTRTLVDVAVLERPPVGA
ncbi:MAG: GNAT family N-acetyltransferase [Burkholderiales bacterium]|nr:GNAT family N-acetyltransferase [Burkholderiales bacterium]